MTSFIRNLFSPSTTNTTNPTAVVSAPAAVVPAPVEMTVSSVVTTNRTSIHFDHVAKPTSTVSQRIEDSFMRCLADGCTTDGSTTGWIDVHPVAKVSYYFRIYINNDSSVCKLAVYTNDHSQLAEITILGYMSEKSKHSDVILDWLAGLQNSALAGLGI